MTRLFLACWLVLATVSPAQAQSWPQLPSGLRLDGGGGSVAFSHLQHGSSNSQNTIALTGVTAGSLIALYVKWEGTGSISAVSDGTSAFSAGTQVSHGNGDLHGQWWYLLSSVASGDLTYTTTNSGTVTFKRLRIWEFSYADTASLDAQAAASGTSAAPSSGTMTYSGAANTVVLGGYGEYSGETISSMLTNGDAADLTTGETTVAVSWEKVYTSAPSNGAASATLGSSRVWIVNGIAFKATAGGATPAFGLSYGQRSVQRGLARGILRTTK